MAEKTRVKVLSSRGSMFGMRVLIALKEKGVEYEYQEENVPYEKSPLLLQSNPVHKKVPVLLHDGRPICESLIILQYIDEVWASPDGRSFLPEDPYARALERFWADYVDKKVYEGIRLVTRNEEGSDLMEQGKRDLKVAMATLDKALRDVFGGGRYFRGEESIGVLDMTMASYLFWFATLESMFSFKVLEESECPCLYAWAQDLVQLPSVKAALSICPPHQLMEGLRLFRKTVVGLKQ